MESGLKGKLKNQRANNMDASSSAKLKRTRASSNGYLVVPSCLVDGCKSDLSKCRDYHRRHKVCELHSKTPKVTIKGQEQRFCQQCSRFHSLVEFDEGKRSCRKRLDGHNRRRRKSQPESTCINSARFFSNYQSTRFLPFHSPQLLTTAGMSSALAGQDGIFKAENDIPNNSSVPIYSSQNGEKHFGLLEGMSKILSEPSACQPPFGTRSHLDNCGNHPKVFSSWLYRENESDCALSLLSPTPPDSKEIGFSDIMQSNPILSTQSSAAGHLHFSALGLVGEPMASTSIKNSSSSNSSLHYSEMFQIRPDGSSAGGHMFYSPL